MMQTLMLCRVDGWVKREGEVERGLALVEEWEGPMRGRWMIIHVRSGLMLYGVDREEFARRARALLLELTDWAARTALELQRLKPRADGVMEIVRREGAIIGNGPVLPKSAT